MLRITYAGHATVLVELDGTGILTDPVLRDRVVHLRRLTALQPWVRELISHPDVIVISHLHFDHFDPPSVRVFDRRTRLLVPRGGAGQTLRGLGFEQVMSLGVEERARVGAVDIRGVYAKHSGSRGFPPWLSGPALGYLFQASRSVYFAGDTDLFPEMSSLGCPDVALLPVSGWGRRAPAGDHMDARRAAESLRLLRPKVAIPIHWGTFAPLWRRQVYPNQASAAEDFRRQAKLTAPQVRVCVLRVGETYESPTAAA